jgi:hypothetical protein
VVLLKLPQAGPVQPAPERLQVTAWLTEGGFTVAVNCCPVPIRTEGEVGETVIVIIGGAIVLLQPENTAMLRYAEASSAARQLRPFIPSSLQPEFPEVERLITTLRTRGKFTQ